MPGRPTSIMTPTDGTGRSRRPVLALVLAVGVVLAGCADEEPEDFTVDNRNGFMAACTRPVEDSRVTTAVCQCVFDATTDLEFGRFVEIDDILVADPEADLPDELVEIIADCYVAESGL